MTTTWIVIGDAAAEGGHWVIEVTGAADGLAERFDDRLTERDPEPGVQRVCATVDELIAELDGVDPEGIAGLEAARAAVEFTTIDRGRLDAVFEAWIATAEPDRGLYDRIRAA